METSRDTREKILIQTELEEAGFDLLPLKKMLLQSSLTASSKDRNDLLQEELDRWSNNYIDVNALVKKLLDAERANRKLREENSGKNIFYYAVTAHALLRHRQGAPAADLTSFFVLFQFFVKNTD